MEVSVQQQAPAALTQRKKYSTL